MCKNLWTYFFNIDSPKGRVGRVSPAPIFSTMKACRKLEKEMGFKILLHQQGVNTPQQNAQGTNANDVRI